MSWTMPIVAFGVVAFGSASDQLRNLFAEYFKMTGRRPARAEVSQEIFKRLVYDLAARNDSFGVNEARAGLGLSVAGVRIFCGTDVTVTHVTVTDVTTSDARRWTAADDAAAVTQIRALEPAAFPRRAIALDGFE